MGVPQPLGSVRNEGSLSMVETKIREKKKRDLAQDEVECFNCTSLRKTMWTPQPTIVATPRTRYESGGLISFFRPIAAHCSRDRSFLFADPVTGFGMLSGLKSCVLYIGLCSRCSLTATPHWR
jgi:hypothetical protein